MKTLPKLSSMFPRLFFLLVVILRAGDFIRDIPMFALFIPRIDTFTLKTQVEKERDFREYFSEKRPTDFYRSSRPTRSETMYIYVYIYIYPRTCGRTHRAFSANQKRDCARFPKFRTTEKSVGEAIENQRRRHTREQRQTGMIADDLPTMIKQLTSIIRFLTVLN